MDDVVAGSVDDTTAQEEHEVTSTTVEAPLPVPESETGTTTEAMENLCIQSGSSMPDVHCTTTTNTFPDCEEEASEGLGKRLLEQPPPPQRTTTIAIEEEASAPTAGALEEEEEGKERSHGRKPSHENSVASWIDAVTTGSGGGRGAADGADANQREETSFAAMFAPTAVVGDTESWQLDSAPKRRAGKNKGGEEKRSATQRGKRTRTASSASASAAEPRERDPALHAFRHSQRSLRKGAQGLCMKDVLANAQVFSPVSAENSLTGDERQHNPQPNGHGDFNGFFSPATADSNPFSPAVVAATGTSGSSLLSPASPTSSSHNSPASPWSPALVSDITKNFLANVERQKKQTVERLLPRELGSTTARVYSPSSRVNQGSSGTVAKKRRFTPPPPALVSTPSNPQSVMPEKKEVEGFPPHPPPASPSLTTAVMEELLLGAEAEEEEERRADPFAAPLAATCCYAGDGDADDGASALDSAEGEEVEELVIRDGDDADGGGEEVGDGRHLYAAATYVSEHSMRLHQSSRVAANTSFASYPNDYSLSMQDSNGLLATDGGGGGAHAAIASLAPPSLLGHTNSHLSASQLQLEEASQQLQQERHRQQEEAAEEANTRAATRRHEIWKLKQRNIKAQRLLHASSHSSTKTPTTPGQGAGTKVSAQLRESPGVLGGMMRNLATHAQDIPNTARPVSSSPSPTAGGSGTGNGHALQSFDVNGPGSPTSLITRKGFSSIRDMNLSQSDVSMIVRLNSFDRTSSQKVVVFGTAKESENKKK